MHSSKRENNQAKSTVDTLSNSLDVENNIIEMGVMWTARRNSNASFLLQTLSACKRELVLLLLRTRL